MAESLYSTNLWLPSEKDAKMSSCLNFPTEFPYECDSFGSNSDLNSPVESVVSSTDSSEGSCEDDEFFLGLAQKLAWTSLCETEESKSPCFNLNNTKVVKAGSPQSTLSGIDAWFRHESPSSQLKSVLFAENEAREAARLKMCGQTTSCLKNGSFIRGLVGAPTSIPVTNSVEYELFSNQNCARNLAYTAQVQQIRQELVLQALYASSLGRQPKVGWTAAPTHRKPEIQNRDMNIVDVTRRCGGGVGTGGFYHSSRIPPPQNHPLPPISSAVRRMHPGGPAVKRASSGTGVFLPRRHVNTSDFRPKQGNPAIRFPEEIKTPIQAPIMDSLIYRRNNPLRPIPRGLRAEGAMNQELHQLPQEWTY